jgi:hypothetical protein
MKNVIVCVFDVYRLMESADFALFYLLIGFKSFASLARHVVNSQPSGGKRINCLTAITSTLLEDHAT